MTVTWSASAGASSYNVYWSTTQGAGIGGTKVSGVTSPYVKTGLTNGTRYYFVVTAVNAAGESTASTEVSAVPVLHVPAAPTGVQATPANGQVSVSWTASSGATSYNLYWSTTAGAGTGGTKITGATSPYVHGGLTNGTTYYYVVTAVNAAGESGPSAQVSAVPAPNPPPPAPSDVVATGGNTQVSVSWSAVSGATSYNLYWSTTAGSGTGGTKVAGVTSPYVKTGLTNGTPYYFVVTAVNGYGESSPSAEATATPSALPFVYATVLTTSDGSTPVFGFLQSVEVCADANCSNPISTATVTVNGTAIPWNATRGQYLGAVHVAAGAAVTLTVTVGGATCTASGTQFTQAPTISSPLSGATWQASNANAITWTGGAPTTGATYVVGVVDSQGSFVFPAGDHGPAAVPIGTTTTSVPANTLAAGSYQVMVGIGTAGIAGQTGVGIPVANAASGSSLWLGILPPLVPVTVQSSAPQPPAAPTNVVATAGDRQVSVRWDAATGATSYNLYWSTTSGSGTGGTKISNVTSPYVQTGLTNGTAYYYVVTAVNANGESLPSSQVSATPAAPVSAPYIYAQFLSMSDGSATPTGWGQQVEVCADAACSSPISNATVTVNTHALTWNATDAAYEGVFTIGLGDTVTVSVTTGGTTYSGTGTQFTQAPAITAPANLATWQASAANTISWSGGAPTTNATYVTGVIDSQGHFVYPAGDHGPLEVAIGTTSVTVPAGTLTAGGYAVMTGIGTPGIVNRTSSGIAIPNAASGSGMWLGVVTSPFVNVLVQ